MLLNAILTSIDNMLGWILDKIPNVNVSLTEFIISFNQLVEGTKAMNYILPIKEALVFTGILLGVKFALMIFWATTRVLNLLRGAG